MEQGSNCWHELLLQRCNKGAIWSVTPWCKGAVDRRGVTWEMIYCCKCALQAPGSNLKHRVLLRGIQSKLFRVVFCRFFLQFKAPSYFARFYRAAVDVLDRVAPVLKAPTSGHRDFKLKVGKNFKKYFSGQDLPKVHSKMVLQHFGVDVARSLMQLIEIHSKK